MYSICTVYVQYVYASEAYTYCTYTVHILYNGHRKWPLGHLQAVGTAEGEGNYFQKRRKIFFTFKQPLFKAAAQKPKTMKICALKTAPEKVGIINQNVTATR